MTEADLVRIESSLKLSLPAEYRKFLRDHSDELRRLDEANSSPYHTVVIWTDPVVLIKENQEARRLAKYMRVGTDDRPWPKNYLVTGTNGGGDYFFVHRDGTESGLWFWDHESQEIQCRYATLADYLTKLRQEAGESSGGIL